MVAQSHMSGSEMAAGVFLVPFTFCYSPALIGLGSFAEVLHAAASALLGIACLSVAAIGWFAAMLPRWMRVILAAAAVALIVPGWLSDTIGVGVGVVAVAAAFVVILRRKRAGQPLGAESQD